MADATPVQLSLEEKTYLLDVARRAIRQTWHPSEDVPEPPSALVQEPLGAFVTLERQGHLRGCIGTMIGQIPLYQTVARMAKAAAFEDHRFPQVREDELGELEISVSVLGPLSRCLDPERVEIGRHGLLLIRGGRSGVFLPQVPVEQGWDRLTYLQQLCGKAGLPPDSWKAADAELYWYEAAVVSEEDF